MSSLSPKKIMVIGGSGFIGRSLVKALQEYGCDISLLNRGNKLVKGTRQLTADRNIASQVSDVSHNIGGTFDAVIDLSSYSRAQTQIAWENFSQQANRWLHLSTAAVYRETPGRAPNEKDAIGGARAWGEYGLNKSDAESFLFEQAEGTKITILRPPYIYGPDNNLDRETFIWSRLLRNKPVLIPGDGTTRIQFLHASDLANAFITVLRGEQKSACSAYNVAAKEQLTFAEYVAGLAHVAGTPNSAIIAGDAATEFIARQFFPFRDYPCLADATLAYEELSWKPQLNFSFGFEQTWKHMDVTALSNRSLETQIEDQILERLSRSFENQPTKQQAI